MRNGFVGRFSKHAFKLSDRTLRVALVLIVDAEVEPGVRQRWIPALHLLQERYRLLFPPWHLQQRERIVQFVACRIGRDCERLPKLPHRILLGGGILVEGFAEIAVLIEKRLIMRFRTRWRQNEYQGDEAQPPFRVHGNRAAGSRAITPWLSSMVRNWFASTFPMDCLVPLGHSISIDAAVSFPKPNVAARSLAE